MIKFTLTFVFATSLSAAFLNEAKADACPPGYYDCEGKEVGDSCTASQYGDVRYATCQLDNTSVCEPQYYLNCVNEGSELCAGKQVGGECGEFGDVCALFYNGCNTTDGCLACTYPYWEKCEGKSENDNCGEGKICLDTFDGCPSSTLQNCLLCLTQSAPEIGNAPKTNMFGCTQNYGAISESGFAVLFLLILSRRRRNFFST